MRWLDNHEKEYGFAFTITHSEKDKEDGIPQHRKYRCMKGRPYVTHKEAHATKERNRGHNNKENISDAGSMYLELIKHQQANPTFYIDAYFEGYDNYLTRLFWMSPNQQQLWARFHDVVLLNTTAKTNCHSMILCVIILIDNHNRSRLVATAIISDETKDTRVEITFEKRWNELLHKYPDASSYLQYQLYKYRESWVLCFTHRAFNAGVQSTQRVECYNGIIKSQVNGQSNLLELENNIKKLLEKTSHFTRLNESIGQLPVNRKESYYSKYFNKVDISCQKFLTLAILKLQRDEINRSIHYRCYIVDLKDELKNCVYTEPSNEIFAEDMFDANIVELEQLIAGLELARIIEVWHVASLDKKNVHFIVLYDDTTHLCTCLTLINRGLVCQHFFSVMLVSKVAKFHTRLILQRWYLNTLDESVTTLENEPVISIVSNEEFNKPGNAIHIDFSHLEDICGSHIFTKHISHEMVCRERWGKGFGMLKKILNLAIVTNRAEELYKIHEKLVKEMKNEIKSQNSQAITENNELQEFAHTINNPTSVKTKGRSSKRIKAFNNVTNILNSKNTKSKMPRIILDSRNDMSDTESISDTEETIVNKRKCRICNMKGHNSRTCPDLAESNIAELKPADNNEEISTNKRKCRICSLEGHNARTCPSSMESNISEIKESGSDAEEININKRKCGICGLEGHNARTC
ncbi:hypothetical protein C2G38_2176301 [Gigaspora rosea]|uniref:SWIM-type domain-containing protein n=1 Tax=Gigaspora rosea TaxID=44941 RepID=A0A397VKN2_9GLOM|nr:hypothetical protein C2G38_2176301 [Gigaspora rosea]